jgi:hypothetical protein
MRLPSEFDFDWWDFLVGYLAQYPLIQSTIIPSYREPTLGNLTDEDRIPLTGKTTTGGLRVYLPRDQRQQRQSGRQDD